MSDKHTEERSRANRPSRGRADLVRLREMTEAEIESTSPPDLANLPEGFWERAEVVTPPPKEAISMRVDQDVLEWFRSQGPRYQTRMNAVLRSYMDAIRSHSGRGLLWCQGCERGPWPSRPLGKGVSTSSLTPPRIIRSVFITHRPVARPIRAGADRWKVGGQRIRKNVP